ncbi:hypothetical protein F2981_32750 (plasmid) [Sinorhizobium meliloti]|nr:hypothetical protein [Sinorhizobium meliloti]
MLTVAASGRSRRTWRHVQGVRAGRRRERHPAAAIRRSCRRYPELLGHLQNHNAQVDVPRLQLSLQLASLTNNNVELIDAIRASNREATSLRELAIDLDMIGSTRSSGTMVLQFRRRARAKRLTTPQAVRKRHCRRDRSSAPDCRGARLARGLERQTPDNFSAGATQLMERSSSRRIRTRQWRLCRANDHARRRTARWHQRSDDSGVDSETRRAALRRQRRTGRAVRACDRQFTDRKPFAGGIRRRPFRKAGFPGQFQRSPLETRRR